MKLIIHNFGPIKKAEVIFSKINVLIGPQSSGKSCILKVACHCAWVEKRIALFQSANGFGVEKDFFQQLLSFHKLVGYEKENTYISYESEFMQFEYDNYLKTFLFHWKDARWEYKRHELSYIPAERNIIGVIPNWFEVKLNQDNLRSFLGDWEQTRKHYVQGVDILNLGVRYRYDESKQVDLVEMDGGQSISIAYASSGLQSLIPLQVYLNYLSTPEEKTQSLKSKAENEHFLDVLYKTLFVEQNKDYQQQERPVQYQGAEYNSKSATLAFVGGHLLTFGTQADSEACKELYANFTTRHGIDLFIEEPELNLFPPTQKVLAEWLKDYIKGIDGNLFVSTHSPYLVDALLESTTEDDVSIMLMNSQDDGVMVRNETREEIESIKYDGIDPFFNLENLVAE